MDKVRYGIVGMGNQGSYYAFTVFKDGKLGDAVITAVCDHNPAKLERAKNLFGDTKVEYFDNYIDMMDSGLCDAILVEIPHYFHPEVVKECFKRGLHVICEKPAGVYTKQVREMNEASKNAKCLFGMMFNQRTNCVYRKMRELIHSGEYGRIRRVNWIITNWYRTQSYYNSGSWRATWSGEGGGVLLNQAPHNLDLWQWICGMPSKVKAVCHEGKWHDIEVEDDVSIYVEYPNGATGTFITTTGDCPGSNRLEITLDKAKIVVNDSAEIKLYVLDRYTSEHLQNAAGGFEKLTGHWEEVETDGKNEQHVGVLNAFAAHILRGEPLVAEGYEGINGLTISNAAFLSSWLDKTVELPIDEDLYYDMLQQKIAGSKSKKEVKEQIQADMSSTF